MPSSIFRRPHPAGRIKSGDLYRNGRFDGPDQVGLEFFEATPVVGAYTADITPASYSSTAASVLANVARRADVTAAGYTTTAASILASIGWRADISPAGYTTTAASILANAARLAGVTPASYATTAASIALDRTWRADVSSTSYLSTASLIDALYSGAPAAPAAGLAQWVRRRRR